MSYDWDLQDLRAYAEEPPAPEPEPDVRELDAEFSILLARVCDLQSEVAALTRRLDRHTRGRWLRALLACLATAVGVWLARR